MSTPWTSRPDEPSDERPDQRSAEHGSATEPADTATQNTATGNTATEPADTATGNTATGSTESATDDAPTGETPIPPNPFAAGGGQAGPATGEGAPHGQPAWSPTPAGGTPYPAPYTPAAGTPYAPYPPPYGQPAYPPLGGYQSGPATSGLAVASLVCGIVGFFVAGLTSIPAVICGHLAWPETNSGRAAGHGMTVAGLILGYLQIVGWIAFWIFIAVAASSGTR